MNLSKFTSSTLFVLQGFKIIFSKPKFLFLALFPLTIDILIFFMGLSYGSFYLNMALDAALGFIFPAAEGIWYQIAYYPLLILFWLVFLVSLSAIVYLIASVIAAPFNAFLAESILVHKGYVEERHLSVMQLIQFSLKMFLVALMRSGILIALSLGLLILSFFPGLNIITSYMAAMILGFDAADYALELKGYGVSERFRSLREFLPEYAGMGFSLALILLIPGFVLLLMPFIVAGASLVIGKALKEAS